MLLKIAGTAFMVIGGVGIILPLLPTTPFLLLAAVCYARSSERWYLIMTIGYSAAFVVPFFIGKVALILIAVCVSVHILSFPTLEPDVKF
jgi:uncharacterized membrane protein YbaN (DUF454 family)